MGILGRLRMSSAKSTLGKIYFWISCNRSIRNPKAISKIVHQRREVIRASNIAWVISPRKRCLRMWKCPKNRCKGIWVVRILLNSQRRHLRGTYPSDKVAASSRRSPPLRWLSSPISRTHTAAAMPCCSRSLLCWTKCPSRGCKLRRLRIWRALNHIRRGRVCLRNKSISGFRGIWDLNRIQNSAIVTKELDQIIRRGVVTQILALIIEILKTELVTKTPFNYRSLRARHSCLNSSQSLPLSKEVT